MGLPASTSAVSSTQSYPGTSSSVMTCATRRFSDASWSSWRIPSGVRCRHATSRTISRRRASSALPGPFSTTSATSLPPAASTVSAPRIWPVCGFEQRDIGKVIENAVFLKLAGEGWDIRSGRAGAAEVDFVCDRAGASIYVQAACLVPDAATRAREFGSLLGIHDAWPRYLVSLDPLRADDEGVRHLGLREFLSRPSPGSPASPASQ
jgi:hypothetical protein